MKMIIITALLFSVSAFADVAYDDCQADALTYANHTRAVAPLPECAGVISAEADKVEFSSGPYKAYGKGRMLYVDKKDADGNVIERNLVAGDQTELLSIEKIFIDVTNNRLFVININGPNRDLHVYKFDFLGNVTPLNVMRSTALLSGATSVKTQDEDEIEVINAQGTWLINSNAETRQSRSKQVPVSIKAKPSE